MKRQVLEHDISSQVLAALPRTAFEPAPERIVWAALHLLLIGGLTHLSIASPSIAVRAAAGVAIGHSLGILAFVGHEILHGSVVRKRWLIRLLGGLCFAHCGLLPGVWRRWHNSMHHRFTQTEKDPDCYGAIRGRYKYIPLVRKLELISPGSGTPYSFLYLFIAFTLQTITVVSMRDAVLTKRRERLTASAYFFSTMVSWVGLAHLASGIPGVLFLFGLPLAICNLTIMLYIVTNHGLSPMTDSTANPLWTSLTVRSFSWIEDLHLQFGYHVEHHVCPAISPKHAREIRRILLCRWPTLHQEMKHLAAIRHLYLTPRFYATDTRLQNPRTGKAAGTLHSGHFASNDCHSDLG